MRAQVADAFLGKFQLKTEEVKILRGSRDGTLHPVSFTMCFFDVIVVFFQNWVDYLETCEEVDYDFRYQHKYLPAYPGN